MTKTNYSVLIIEDEPLVHEAYKTVLNSVENIGITTSFNIQSAFSIDEALTAINKSKIGIPIDLVLLDINLKNARTSHLHSGEDIGLILRKQLAKCKIMVLTSLNSNYRINNIMRSLNPEGLLIKSEMDFASLKTAIESILDNSPYYSKSVLQLMRKHMTNDYHLDQNDRQILYHISKGAKLRHLQDHLPLSKSAIEHRKRQLKLHFQIDQGDDRDLILKAEEYGFL